MESARPTGAELEETKGLRTTELGTGHGTLSTAALKCGAKSVEQSRESTAHQTSTSLRETGLEQSGGAGGDELIEQKLTFSEERERLILETCTTCTTCLNYHVTRKNSTGVRVCGGGDSYFSISSSG